MTAPEINFCVLCNREEIWLPEYFMRCKTCRHVYRDEGDMVQADLERRLDGLTQEDWDEYGEVWPRRASEIDVCGMCGLGLR